MITYILHVTVITTVCFLFYKLMLQKETFYRLNRWTLMTCRPSSARPHPSLRPHRHHQHRPRR